MNERSKKEGEENAQNPSRLDTDALRSRKIDREAFTEIPRSPIALVLDGVYGNYNKGALFRLADAFLVEKLHFCGTTLEHWHRRFKKSARGTQGWVPHSVDEDTLEVLGAYRERGYQIVVVEQCTGSIPLLETRFSSPVCIVLGGEIRGVNPAVVEAADLVVELPTMGMANSLNVSMSAGMVVLMAFQQLDGSS